MDSLAFFLNHMEIGIVGITESWLTDSADDTLLFGRFGDRYNIFRCDRHNKSGAGVVLLFRHTLSSQLIFKESYPDSYEILSCAAFVSDSITLRTILIYRTPSCVIFRTFLGVPPHQIIHFAVLQEIFSGCVVTITFFKA